jgi:hypothetical protein
MRLDYAFLAEASHRNEDGRLFVLGGDIAAVASEILPCAMNLSLAARFEVDGSEVAKPHTFEVDFEFPDRVTRLSICEEKPLAVMANPIDSSEPTGAALQINLQLVFPSYGKYLVRLLGDGVLVKSLPIWLTKEKIR